MNRNKIQNIHVLSLVEVINKGENESVEFKKNFDNSALTSINAFANTKGGKVIVGVKDDKSISGIEINNETIQNWINEVKNKTNPPIIPLVETFEIDKKKIAVFEIDEYPIKPVSLKGRYFKRAKNSNHQMSITEISNEHLKTVNSSWDFYKDTNHSINDLSEEKIYNFIEKIGINVDLITFLNKFELTKANKITFGAFLLFTANEPLLSTIEVGRFSTETIIKDSLTVRTDLISEVKIVLEFVQKHLSKGYIITGKPQREERWEYPLDAIREIIINMIVHRDYRSSSDSIIKIFNNRIEFFNPGSLLGSLSIEKVMSGKYRSHLRNKQIANIFKEIGLIEKYGSGIKRIFETFNSYGLKEPMFESLEDGFLVTVWNGNKTTQETTQEMVIELLLKNPNYTRMDLVKLTGKSNSTIKEHLANLKNEGRLKRIGSDKGGYWMVILHEK